VPEHRGGGLRPAAHALNIAALGMPLALCAVYVVIAMAAGPRTAHVRRRCGRAGLLQSNEVLQKQ
jgi:hypothetical protein